MHLIICPCSGVSFLHVFLNCNSYSVLWKSFVCVRVHAILEGNGFKSNWYFWMKHYRELYSTCNDSINSTLISNTCAFGIEVLSICFSHCLYTLYYYTMATCSLYLLSLSHSKDSIRVTQKCRSFSRNVFI